MAGTLSMSTESKGPRVSIITAVLNAEDRMLRTLESLAALTFRDFEWIVIDGGSQDETVNIVRRHGGAARVLVSEKDEGIYDAWNKGLNVCRGEWIGFLGAGDAYEPGGLTQYMEAVAERGRAGVAPLQYVSSRVRLISEGRTVRTIGREWRWATFRNWMCVAHVGWLHHRRLFEGGRRFNKAYRICGDYEFLLGCGPGLRAGFVPWVTASMLTGGASDSMWRAARESEAAKVSTGARNPWIARYQRAYGLGKGYARRALWY